MKINKLISSMLICGCGLTITGCIPNAGDDNDPTRPGNNSIQKISSPTLSVDIETSSNYLVKGLLDAAFDKPLGFHKLALNISSDILLFAIFGPGVDPNQPLFDKLDQIDQKLDEINDKLDVSLALNGETLNTVSEFYRSQMKSNYENTLAEVVEDTNAVKSKYLQYKDQSVFGDFNSLQQSQLFDYAKNNCSYNILMALDAKNADIISKDSQSRNLKSMTSTMPVYELFNNFKTKFIASPNAGTILNRLASRKLDYIKSIKQIQPNSDLMAYISYYNQQTLINQGELFSAYQQMYNMQLAQLAYKYACGAEIRMDNLNLSPIKATGLDGFTQAVKLLNQAYDRQFNSLTDSIKKGLSVIDNQDLFQIINQQIFKPERPFLAESSFLPANNNLSQCTITSLKFIPISSDNNQGGTGLAKLGTECTTLNSPKQHTVVKVYQEIPYAQVGNQIQRYAMSGIYFDQSNLNLQVKNKDYPNPTDLNPKDINNLCNAIDFSQWNNLKNMVEMASTRKIERAFYNYDAFWYGASINFAPEFYLLNQMYTPDWKHEDAHKEWNRDFPHPNYFYLNGGYGGSIRYDNETTNNLEDKNVEDRNFARWNWYLANYDEKTVCIKTGFVYKDATSYKSVPEHKSFLGIACLGNQCKRNSNKELEWSDGTIVRIDGSILSDGKGSWKITGTSLDPDRVIIKKFNFVPPTDYKDWQQNGKIGLSSLYLDGKVSFNKPQLEASRTQPIIILQSANGLSRMMIDNELLVLESQGKKRSLLPKELNMVKINTIQFKHGDIIINYSKAGQDKSTSLLANEYKQNHVKWINDPYSKLVLQDDGNLVVYSSDSSGQLGYQADSQKPRVIWAYGDAMANRGSSTQWDKIDNGTN